MKYETLNGKLFICSSCKKIHLEFGNIGMDFQSEKTLKEMLTYLNGVKQTSQSFPNQDMPYRRTIMIPFENTNLKILLNDDEIEELTSLFTHFIALMNGEKITVGQKEIPMKIFNGISSIRLN
ncbi:DUF6686 family protein [Mangrovibacterium diazotrophicum]|uniref:Uncharacterized protein n=1 Tax=Mangrovibacterium diazotrophicum TaxID=1261403 RepID=A0A419W7D5_9BACT|nr:DUF6686 family protein [Mangrovibacterium diazotrophicum]RKD91391.1 hypothetical protein BC643_1744 [Mangrovibacterium diazotrophicum]